MATLGEIARVVQRNPDGTTTNMRFHLGGEIVPIPDSPAASQQASLNKKAPVVEETDAIDPTHPSGKAQLIFHHAVDLFGVFRRRVNVFVEGGIVRYRKEGEEPVTPTTEPLPVYQIVLVPKEVRSNSRVGKGTIFEATSESTAREPNPKKRRKGPTTLSGFTGYWRGKLYRKGQQKQ